MTDPITFERIGEAVAAGRPDPTRDEELPLGIGSMPMSALAAFQDMSIDHDILDKPGPVGACVRAPRSWGSPLTPRVPAGRSFGFRLGGRVGDPLRLVPRAGRVPGSNFEPAHAAHSALPRQRSVHDSGVETPGLHPDRGDGGVIDHGGTPGMDGVPARKRDSIGE